MTSIPTLTGEYRELACEYIVRQLGMSSEALTTLVSGMSDEVIIKNIDTLWSDGGFSGWIAFIRECELRASRISANSETTHTDPLRAAVRDLYLTIRSVTLVPNPDLPESSQLLLPYNLVTRLQPYESVKAAELDIAANKAYLVLETAETKSSRGRDRVTHSLRLITWERLVEPLHGAVTWRVTSDFSTVIAHSEYVLRGRVNDLINHLHQRRQELDSLRSHLGR